MCIAAPGETSKAAEQNQGAGIGPQICGKQSSDRGAKDTEWEKNGIFSKHSENWIATQQTWRPFEDASMAKTYEKVFDDIVHQGNANKPQTKERLEPVSMAFTRPLLKIT